MTALWIVTLFTLIDINRRFRETCCLYRQSKQQLPTKRRYLYYPTLYGLLKTIEIYKFNARHLFVFYVV